MYKFKKGRVSEMNSVDTTEGETIERKIERILENKENITDGAPEIFTERKEGVLAGFDIRTDRWEIAAEAMDSVSRSNIAKRDSTALEIVKDDEDPKETKKDSGAESIQGKSDQKEGQ